MAKKIVRRQLNLTNPTVNKENIVEHDHVLEAAEKKCNIVREAIKENTERSANMDKRIESTEARFCEIKKMKNALVGSNFEFQQNGGSFTIGGKMLVQKENGWYFNGDVYRRPFDVIKEINVMVREGLMQPVEKERIKEMKMSKMEMEFRLELIKKRHKVMMEGLEDLDEDVAETPVFTSNRTGDEDMEEFDEDYLDNIFGIEKEEERDLPYKKEGRVVFKKKEESEELSDIAWFREHRRMQNGGKVIPTKDAKKGFIQSLRDNRELAIQWFPELDLLEEEVADQFLKDCLPQEEWDEQHNDRAVHFYKCGLDS